MKKILLSFTLSLLAVAALAQQGGVRGTLISRQSRQPVDQAKLTVDVPGGAHAVTGPDGTFVLDNLPEGVWKVDVEALEFMPLQINIRVGKAVSDLGNVSLSPLVAPQMDDANFTEFDIESASGDAQSMPVSLAASKDVYASKASYNFSEIRFRQRGYDTSLAGVYLNGVYLNDAMTGYTPWSLWSGLNDATRNQDNLIGIAPADYGLGNVNGLTNIDIRASSQRKGYRFTLANTNATYRLRAAATYASGRLDNGWAYAMSVSLRWGDNDWVRGVYTNGLAYYASVEKEWRCDALSLSIIGSPSERGAQNASTQEVYDLVGSNTYNSNWGFQDGKIRNARVRRTHEPVIVLNYRRDLGYRTQLNAALSYRFGFNGYSALDWYRAPDPRPDYYRKLPSYYNDNDQKYGEAWEAWKSDNNTRHLNWDQIYNYNYGALYSDNPDNTAPAGIQNTRRSSYAIEERRADQQDFNFTLRLNNTFRSFKTSGGIDLRYNKTEYFKVMKDLLGGDSWLNIDGFAQRDFGSEFPNLIQNDLNDPNRVIKKGDKYGYDYYGVVQNARLWAMTQLNKGHFEAFLGAQVEYNAFWREGRWQKGYYVQPAPSPYSSLGKSEKSEFIPWSVKAGLTYKISAAHQLSIAARTGENAPFFANAFMSPRSRNHIVDNLTTEKITAGELTYTLSLPGVKFRATGFIGQFDDQVKLLSFYDDSRSSFVNFAMTGINQRNIGAEAGFEVALPLHLYLTGAVNVGKYVYTSDAKVTETLDNTGEIIADDINGVITPRKDMPVHWKDYHVPGTPQQAFNLGLEWRSPKFIFVGVDVNYYDRNYIDMNPLRRTDVILNSIPDAADRAATAAQEKFPTAFTLNANVGTGWFIKRKYNLGFVLTGNNLLNNLKIKSSGYEQTRLGKTTSNGVIVDYTPFDSRYFYMIGANYFLTIYFRF